MRAPTKALCTKNGDYGNSLDQKIWRSRMIYPKYVILITFNRALYNFQLYQTTDSYCTSCWGAIPSSKLQGIFAIQKRWIRLLFGCEYSFDHAGYYETCARIRTYEEHKAKKNYCLEHTKPLFNKQKILSLFNLYIYHTFLNSFKVLKTHTPLSLYNLFTQGCRDANFLLLLPKVNLNIFSSMHAQYGIV